MGNADGNVSRPTLLVIDAMSQIFRAFYAVPPHFSITNPAGETEHTNAVYGFVTLLLRVVAQIQPEYIVVAFDLPGPTFRTEEYTEYKANRDAPPDELIPQFDRVRQVVSALGLPRYELAGYEADDILGFMARAGVADGLRILLVTGDRDAFQLINDHVGVVTTNPRTGEPVIYDAEKVAERWPGITPAQIIDLKALQGDSSDNIPGVPGIGEKTAITLLTEYGDLETILASVEQLSGRARKALDSPENHELARLSQKLATIVTDLPLELDLARARIWQPELDTLKDLFAELQFRSLEKRLPFKLEPAEDGAAAGPDHQLGLFAPDTARAGFRTVVDEASAGELLASLQDSPVAGVYPVVKATSEGPVLAGLGIAPDSETNWYLPVITTDGDIDPGLLRLFNDWLADPERSKVTYQTKDLLRALRSIGLDINGFDFDAGIGAYLLGGAQRLDTLDDIVLNRLQLQLEPPESEWPRATGFAGLPAEVLPAAAADRAATLAPLAGDLREDLTDRGLDDLLGAIEMPLIRVLADMEAHGVNLDSALLRTASTELKAELDTLSAAIHEDAGHEFKINSPKQLGAILFEELGLEPGPKTKGGQFSTSRQVLEDRREAHPIIDRVLEFRELDKLKGTYVDALPALVNPTTGRLHTTFSQTVAATGRLSSNNPNLQNIPVRTERGQLIRKAFIAEEQGHVLLAADYSQIELRVLAHICGDESMIAAFHRDEDIHTATAAQMYDVATGAVTPAMRRVAKTTNFGIVYGITEHGLAARTDLSMGEAANLIASYFEKYPAIRRYMDETIKSAYSRGYVATLLGRRRYLPETRARSHAQRQAGERMAINMPIQGTDADIMKIAMIDMAGAIKASGLPVRMILQVHDELLFELPEADVPALAALARQTMESAYELAIPLKVDLAAGPTWGDMGDVD